MTDHSAPLSTAKQRLQVSFPSELPITAKKEELVAAIRKHQVIIVSGETGSGKTTQLPKMCLEAGLGLRGKIGCTQPRRIAALTVSRRIAVELGVQWGHEVGCKIRFSDKTNKNTSIKVMTDGILLAEVRSDPLLSSYEAIIIDEAHERSLTIDFLLGYLRLLLPKRPDLKVIITSATIDTGLFAEAFKDAPIIEVSGRLFPVEIRYSPLQDQIDGDAGNDDRDISYIEHTVHTVREILSQSVDGDVLVFMPSERDIRETVSTLAGGPIEVLPLLGSLSSAEQERVFHSSPRRKVIVATNIAETSITLPNIRFVVDTGLARISRYAPRSRTQRLPIEKIAKSSARQRAGRAGRMREGVCIRLYSEEDFSSRPDFTDPELLRANLADVILRMKAFQLGDIDSFPFLHSPDSRSIKSGFALLHELGALDDHHSLTPIGRELGRLPVDPTIGRMLLQARKEHALPDVLVIAAGISIPDPRERPLDKREKADTAHRTFAHPDSDFLTLLNVWNTFRAEQRSGKSQNQLRRFCKEHFLSYIRMREWMDMHAELAAALDSSVDAPTSQTSAIKRFDGSYRAIHRSILAGHIGQVAYCADANTYRGTSGKQLAIFPGSTLAEKRQSRKDNTSARRATNRDPARDQWIVAAEIVETHRVFARNVARIVPGWVEEIARHLIRRHVENPHWCETKRCVMAHERVSLQGLVLALRRIPFSRSSPEEARELFIRSVLTSEDTTLQYPFIYENRRLCDKVASRLALSGRLNRHSLEESLIAFYTKRLPPIASLQELDKLMLHHPQPELLHATPDDLWQGASELLDDPLFPDHVEIAGHRVGVHYRYNPGGLKDGVTLTLPAELTNTIPARALDGVIPGLREQQILYIIREMPKAQRLQIDNFAEAARCIAADEALQRLPLLEGLAQALLRIYGIKVPAQALTLDVLPEHLQPRFEVRAADGTITGTRDLSTLKQQLLPPDGTTAAPAWKALRAEWERNALTSWDFGDLPEEIKVASISGVQVFLYPALIEENDGVALRLLDDRSEAVARSYAGVNALAKRALHREVQDITRPTSALEACKPLLTLFTTVSELKSDALSAVLTHILAREPSYPLRLEAFESLLALARSRLPGLVQSIVRWSSSALDLRRQILAIKRPYTGMRSDLDTLLPRDFLVATPFEQLSHLPRYLKAMLLRAERADNDPKRYKEREDALAPYLQRLKTTPASELPPHFRWMVEEFKVSLFAQELGTAYPISSKRLDKALLN